MAVEFKVEHQRTSEYRFYPEDIEVKPKLNGRHELPDIQWLIDDIIANGQSVPVAIRNEAGKPVLAFGYSRWRAVSEINKKKLLPVKLQLRCTYFKGNEFDGFVANIHENLIRNAPSEIDDAHNVVYLERWGQTLEQIAAIYRQDVAWVKKRMALVSLTPEMQALVREKKVKPNAAEVIAKLSSEHQAETVKEVKEGKRVTAASVKKRFRPPQTKLFETTDSGQPETRHITLPDVRKVLLDYIENGDLPNDLNLFTLDAPTPAMADTVHGIFVHLLDWIDGKQPKNLEAA